MSAKHLQLQHIQDVPKENVILELITYNREKYNRYDKITLDDLLKKVEHGSVNWINLDGLSNTSLIEKMQSHFCLNSLIVEDILQDQRPKAEEYDDYLFVTLKMLYK